MHISVAVVNSMYFIFVIFLLVLMIQRWRLSTRRAGCKSDHLRGALRQRDAG
jgi:hypothetical protein